MARIRSIHPGLFTDEAFMSASAHARLLIIGIWCEAWDDGAFEWKPLTLKARIFPIDNVDVAALLKELGELGFINPFEVRGRQYGAIRNFQRFQRPKKPNSSGVLPQHLFEYVGRYGTSSEPVPNPPPTGGGKSSQMEDGGGRRERKKSSDASASGANGASDTSVHERAYFERGKEILGEKAGGLLVRVLRAKGGNIALARAIIEEASQKQNPAEWIGGCLKPKPNPQFGRGPPNGKPSVQDVSHALEDWAKSNEHEPEQVLAIVSR